MIASWEDVVTIGGEEGVYSRHLSVDEVTTSCGKKVELTAPGLRLVLSPAAADELRLWLAGPGQRLGQVVE